MKGLVLAGGAGTRLRPLTYTGAKQLVPVANRPVLFYVIDNLVDAGVTDIGIIISPETGAEIQATLGDGSLFGANFTYIPQDQPKGLAHAVMIAKPYLGTDDFVMYLGDNLVGSKIRNAVSDFTLRRDTSAFLMLKEVANPTSFGVAELNDKGELIGLAEKPKVPKSNFALVGIYMFRSSIFDAIGRITPSPRGELEITDAITKLMELGGRVDCARIESWWLDTGKKDDLLLANDTLMDDWLVAANHGAVDGASKISGRVRIEEGARIERSTIRGPVVIGRNARIVDATIGPFTAIGDEVVVERSSVQHSVIMTASSIIDIALVEDSLIGKRVCVRPGAARRASLSLMVGDDCVVELSSH